MALCSYGRIDLAKEIEHLWKENRIEEIQQKYNNFKQEINNKNPPSFLNRLVDQTNGAFNS